MAAALHIASASDAGYFPGMEVLVCSTLLHVPPESEVHFYIFNGGIDEHGWNTLRMHAARLHRRTSIHPLSFSDELFGGCPALHGNKLTYARLLLADCLPSLDKIIYVDSDIIVGINLEQLRDANMQRRTALAAADAIVTSLNQDCPWLPAAVAQNYPYFNAGVLVLDLAQWRKHRYLEQCLTAISSQGGKCRFWDQTALNYILRDDVTFLPSNWNQVVFNSAAVPAAQINIHLISDKPWLNPFPRFDHYVWMAFYADFIGSRDWTENLSFSRKLLFYLPRYWPTRWLFWLGLRGVIAATRHPTARARRAQMLSWAMSDFTVLDRLRTAWRRLAALRRHAIDAAELSPRGVVPAKI